MDHLTALRAKAVELAATLDVIDPDDQDTYAYWAIQQIRLDAQVERIERRLKRHTS
jgi:hypothetical protein